MAHAYGHFLLGVAPGLPNAAVAVAVVEQRIRPDDRGRPATYRLDVVHLARLPPGFGLAEVGKHVADLARGLDNRDPCGGPEILVDAGFLGAEAWRDRFDERKPILVTVTAGGEERAEAGNRFVVPRMRLVAPLLTQFQDRRVDLAPVELRPALVDALKAFTDRAKHASGDALEAALDDANEGLVTATALAAWRASKRAPGRRDGAVQRFARTLDSYLD